MRDYILLCISNTMQFENSTFIFDSQPYILTIKISLKMNSPTTNILNSINALKSKLRKDHHELQYIRKQFSLPPTQELPEQNIDTQEPKNNYRNSISVDKSTKSKLLQLRKKHSAEIKELKAIFEEQKKSMHQKFKDQCQQMQAKYEERIKEQNDYICLLEQQLQNSEIALEKSANRICDEAENTKRSIIQYESIIQELNEKNQMLVKMLKLGEAEESAERTEQFRKHKNMANLIIDGNKTGVPEKRESTNPLAGNRARLKFSKADSQGSRRSSSFAPSDMSSLYQSNNSRICSNKNKENINNSNYNSSNNHVQNSQWSDDSILNEETKLRTIKHFWTNQEASIREFR